MKFDAGKLRVASPCHVGWENMSGDGKVRFCRSCELNVYNFAEMTAPEIEKLILRKEGRICGRMYQRTDGTIITRDCPTGLRAARKRVTRTASAVFAAVVGLCSVAFGQAEKEKSCKVVSQGKITRSESKSDLVSIKGTITDLQGAVIPYAEIYLINDKTKKEIKLNTDDAGDFKLKNVPDGTYSARFIAADFKEYKIRKLQLEKRESVKFEISLRPDAVELVGVILAEEPLIDVTSSGITRTITRKMIESLPHKK